MRVLKGAIAAGVAGLCLSACVSGPTIKYSKPSESVSGDGVDDKLIDTRIPFKIRSSLITLAKPSGNEDRATQPKATGGAGRKGGPSNAPDDTPSSNAAPVFAIADVCPPAKEDAATHKTTEPKPSDCLNASTATVAPAEVEAASAVTSDDQAAVELHALDPRQHDIWHWGTRVDLSVTYIENSTLLSSVGVKMVDTRATLLKQVGEAGVAGFGVGGPWGAVAGVLSTAIGSLGLSATSNSNEWLKYTCKDEASPELYASLDDPQNASLKPPLQLMLPVALGLWEARKTTLATNRRVQQPQTGLSGGALHNFRGCWASLPGQNQGWFYQLAFVDTAEPHLKGTVTPLAYFGSKPDAALERNSLPYSACRKAQLFVAWWDDLRKGAASNTTPLPVRSYTVTVADETSLRAMPLPTAGTITMGSTCGAKIDVDSNAPPDNTAAIDALFNAAAAIKKAQDSAATPATGKSK